MPCTCRLPWLAVEWPWSALAGPFLTLLEHIGVKIPLQGTISGNCKQFSVNKSIRWSESPDSLMSGCCQGHEPTQNVSKKFWLKFPVLAEIHFYSLNKTCSEWPMVVKS